MRGFLQSVPVAIALAIVALFILPLIGAAIDNGVTGG